MINKIVDAISVSIDDEFNQSENAYEIYTESLKQGLKEPCFSVYCINPTNELFLNKRYFRTNQFCIQYFPSSDENNVEMNDILERLFYCLELINVNGDLTRGSRMRAEFVDGVLNFFVNYDMFVYRIEESEDAMEELDVNSNVEG